MRISNLLRNKAATSAMRAKKPERVYTVEELKKNRWQLPDETMEVPTNNTREA